MKKTWAVVGGTVLAAAVLAPWGVGLLTEQQWQDATQRINHAQGYVQFDTTSYDRNFYRARINGVVRLIDPVSGAAERLPYQGDVRHGITGSFIDFSFAEEFIPAFAEIELAKAFPDERPSLTLEAKVWGTATLEAKVPAVDYTEVATAETVKMDASFARLVILGAGNRAEFTLRGPVLSVSIPDALHLYVEGLHVDQKMSLAKGHLWTGNGELGVARAEFAERGADPIILEGFNLNSKTWTDNDRFSTATVARVDKVTMEDSSNGPHRIEFAANDVGIDAWNELVAGVNEIQTVRLDASHQNSRSAFQQQMMLFARISESAKKLAVNGVSLGFPEISLGSPEGKLQGRLLLRHPQLDQAEQDQVTLLMERVEGDMSLSLPVALAQHYPQLREQVMRLLHQGLIVEDNGEYRLDAQLKDLVLEVNGNEFLLPPLL